MEKYRIISKDPSDLTQIKFYIQRKRFWGWRIIEVIENNKSVRLTFGSLGEAEIYIYKNYFGAGEVYQPRPNEYWYERYTYSCC
jgi:hypothetical protein